MHIREKALYNLLRLNWLKDPTLAVYPWQVDDYRGLELSEIFSRLEDLGISIDEERFVACSEETDSPEELASLLWTGEDDAIEGQDQVYLLLFELWRRLLPRRETLTLFCDELDHQIHQFVEEGKIEEIDELLVRLEDILDSYVDSGENPKKIFKTISSACAYDLEGFLYEYIMELIHAEEEMFASELIDGFENYISDSKRFEFLRIRLFAAVDPKETVHLLTQLVESLKKDAHFPLLLEIAGFLVSFGQDPLYHKIITKALNWMRTEGDFADILGNLQDYFCCLDQEGKQAQVKSILEKRSGLDPQVETDLNDPDLEVIRTSVLSEN